MKLKDVLKSVGSVALSAFPPYGPLALAAINAALPADKQLDSMATASQAEEAMMLIDPAKRASLLEKSMQLKYETLQAMLVAEANSQHTTRPYIAKGCFHIYSAVTLMITVMIVVSIGKEPAPLVALQGMWVTLAALYGPFPAVLYAYFGLLKKEHENRLNAANGRMAGLGMLTAVASKLLKK